MPGKIYVSYSHRDQKWKDRIVTHLKVLESEGVTIWSDADIPSGADWRQVLSAELADCQIVLLLVSVDSLASASILNTEVPAILKRQAADGLTVLPVLLSPCAWDQVDWLSAIQLFPSNGRPLSRLRKEDLLQGFQGAP